MLVTNVPVAQTGALIAPAQCAIDVRYREHGRCGLKAYVIGSRENQLTFDRNSLPYGCGSAWYNICGFV